MDAAAVGARIWPGRVVSDEDPDISGRVRVRIDQVYGAEDEGEGAFIPDDQLPWAYVLQPVSGEGTGQAWTPPVGALVVVGFWGGDAEWPIVLGGLHPQDADPDHRIPEHVSSYSAGPATRIVKTAGGQVFEMRWKTGEERIVVRAAPGLEVVIDVVQQSVSVVAPQAVSVVAGGQVVVSGQSADVTTTAGPMALTIAGALTATIAGALTLAAAGVAALTAVGILSLFGAAGVLLGTAAGVKRRLLDERFLDPANFPAHTHSGVTVGGGTSGPVNSPIPLVPTVATTDTLAS